jgi:hypothetical protein
MEVRIQDRLVGVGVIDKPEPTEHRFPLPTIAAKESVLVSLEADRTWRSADVYPGSLDPHAMSVAVTALGFRELYDRCTRETAPSLEWKEGDWPWLAVDARKTFDVRLRVAHPRPWLALRYLESPGTRFTVLHGATKLATVAPRFRGDNRWVTTSWPLPEREPDRGIPVSLSTESELSLAHVWAFAPPARYSRETAPFLPWTESNVGAFFTVGGETQLPFEGPGERVRIDYLAEAGRGLSVQLGEARPVRLETPPRPEWKTAFLRINPGQEPVLRLKQLETLAPCVRTIAVE